jgi:hypothetical protein
MRRVATTGIAHRASTDAPCGTPRADAERRGPPAMMGVGQHSAATSSDASDSSSASADSAYAQGILAAARPSRIGFCLAYDCCRDPWHANQPIQARYG